MKIKLLEDVRAADIGMDFTLGLLGKKGEEVDALTGVAAKLIQLGKAEAVETARKPGPSVFQRQPRPRETK